MSTLIATVSEIERCDTLHVIHFSVEGESLSMVSLDIDDTIMIGTQVELALKPTQVAIAKDFKGEVSFSNQLPCKVQAIEYGQLLSSIKLDFLGSSLESIMIRDMLEKMQLEVGDEVIGMFSASALSIVGIVDV